MMSRPNTIAESDDDNIPYANWKLYFDDSKVNITSPNLGFTNIYSYFTDEYIWPRGLPLDEIANKPVYKKTGQSQNKIGVFQGLADIDPDVDAIYRLVINKYVTFDKKLPLILDENTIAPINSQNTMFIQKFFCLMYLPSYVSFRFIDILRGLIAQPIMWLYGYKTAFLSSTVFQERNYHDLMTDFRQEIECYIYPKQIINEVSEVINSKYTVSENLIASYRKLVEIGICKQKEITLLDAWIKDTNNILQYL